MLCELCRKRPATVHVTKVVNNDKAEVAMCQQCAREHGGLGALFSPAFSLNHLLAAFLNDEERPGKVPAAGGAKCDTCNLTYAEFARMGRLGCSDCYDAFGARLDAVLKRIQGSAGHVGKTPRRAAAGLFLQRELSGLRRQLEDAVRQEAYEQAAQLRDRIRLLEKQGPASGD